MELQTALAQCESLIRRSSASFYRAFKELPSPRKEAVFVIYAFCRLIDDSVDEPDQSPFTLDELEERFLTLEQAQGHFIWPALRWLFAAFPIARDPFLRQISGQRRDGVLTRYGTLEELEEYCFLVAGTVGEMLLPVLHNEPDASVVEAGIYLGKAMQIVNIVRDIGEDMGRGRRYVPLELMERFGYSDSDYADRLVNANFKAMLIDLTALADRWFQLGLRGIETYPSDSAFAVELAAAYYRAILDEVKRMEYDVFKCRAVVGAYAKLRILSALKSKYNSRLSERRQTDNGAVS